MLLGLSFAFAEHLDPCTVHQQVQTCRGRHSADGNLQRFLPSAYCAVVRHRSGEPGQMQQALRHPHGPAQR